MRILHNHKPHVNFTFFGARYVFTCPAIDTSVHIKAKVIGNDNGSSVSSSTSTWNAEVYSQKFHQTYM